MKELLSALALLAFLVVPCGAESSFKIPYQEWGDPKSVKMAKGIEFRYRVKEDERGFKAQISMTNSTDREEVAIRYRLQMVAKSDKVIGETTWSSDSIPRGVFKTVERRIPRDRNGEPVHTLLTGTSAANMNTVIATP